jgi:hypothetical protein
MSEMLPLSKCRRESSLPAITGALSQHDVLGCLPWHTLNNPPCFEVELHGGEVPRCGALELALKVSLHLLAYYL